MKLSKDSQSKTRRERTDRATKCCGGFLQRLRNESGMTRGDVATRLHQSPSYVTRMETGKRRIGVVDFMDYVEVLGKNPSQALTALIEELPEAFGEGDSRGKR